MSGQARFGTWSIVVRYQSPGLPGEPAGVVVAHELGPAGPRSPIGMLRRTCSTIAP
jgi:hypothetical protein